MAKIVYNICDAEGSIVRGPCTRLVNPKDGLCDGYQAADRVITIDEIRNNHWIIHECRVADEDDEEDEDEGWENEALADKHIITLDGD